MNSFKLPSLKVGAQSQTRTDTSRRTLVPKTSVATVTPSGHFERTELEDWERFRT